MTPETDDGMMKTGMTRDQFETLLACHGPDLEQWPTDVRTADAEAFAAGHEGKSLLATERAFRRRLAAVPVPDAGADAFLNRLLDVPSAHAQSQANPFARMLRAVGDALGDTHKLFSRTGILTQVTASLMILALGVMIGIGNPSEDQTEMDLSSSLFASSDLNLGGQ